jgi:acyl-CoA hydrolase
MKILSPEECVDTILSRVGRKLVVGVPLGLGKANLVLNALFARACADESIEMTISTALTLERPLPKSDLERRFMGPLIERLFGGYPDLDYATARRQGKLPANVRVHEFFFAPGRSLDLADAQQDYISSNYTHAARDMLSRGVNVVLQMASPGGDEMPGHYSLSCNPDVTLDLVPAMRASGRPCIVIAEHNDQLPFMYGDAIVDEDFFDCISMPKDGGYRLFGTPKVTVSEADYAIGLYSSALIRDGGTLQVGIGSMGDAVIYGIGLRHSQPQHYQQLLQGLLDDDSRRVVEDHGGTGVFDKGLYGASEMLVDGFLDLFERGVLKRKVYDDFALQRLLNEGRIGETPDARMLEALRDDEVVWSPLRQRDIDYLKTWGILQPHVTLHDGELQLGGGITCPADLRSDAALDVLAQNGLGPRLLGASVAHGGFFLGPAAFYAALNDMPIERRKLLKMTSVSRINQLYGGELLDKLQRADARFINSCLMVTLAGAVVSDGLEDGRVVSGVGGQYNFVAMAHALAGGRSIIKVRATRETAGGAKSNIVFNYGHITIPRHLRDIVVTEYGIANLRGRSDAECYAAMLNVADSRFQPALVARAKAAGKLPADFEIPPAHRNNLPARLHEVLAPHKADGLFPAFPFGTDLTADELLLGRALTRLKAATGGRRKALRTLLHSLRPIRDGEDTARLLARMDLASPGNLRERVYRRLLRWALAPRETR